MTEPARAEVESAAAHWDRAFRASASIEQQGSSYALASPLYQERYIARHFGADAPDWIEGLRRALKLEAPFENALALGCGLGEGLLDLQRRGVAQRIHGIDISATAIEDARAAAARGGRAERVTFEVGDFHHCPLSEGAYDLVLMIMSLHHALDLDLVLERVRTALKPGGLFVVN
ncbi:MAG: class I SAM-dependent methyltransferase [Planctomycetes bacterium]|nr:class I SAM-dependent methyltransferase [Planctomycetota bacterium]